MQIRKVAAACVLAFACALPAGGVAAAPAALPDFTRLVKNEGRSVVNISTTQTVREQAGLPQGMEGDPFFEFFRRFAPPQPPREYQAASLGSGFIMSPDGYILTNAHVIARADEIKVTLGDKREFKARVVGSDARTDVALLKIDAVGLPAAKLGKADDVEVGEWVLAIGSPFGFENTVTSGIVSAKGRQLPDESYVPFIQTDAAINPGNSGGPLFNLKGEVVGVNSQIYSRSGGFMGISFAIPIDVALDVADQLKKSGRVARGRIGVSVQEVNKDLAASFGLAKAEGALINTVEPAGPAARAGVRAGDIVLAIDGKPIANGADLQRAIGMIRPGSTVKLQLWRNRAPLAVAVRAEELKEADPRLAEREYRAPEEAGRIDQGKLGLTLAELNAAQLKQVGVPYALVVQGTGAVAARAGITRGDVIVGVAGEALTGRAQFQRLLAAVKPGDVIALQLWRRGNLLFVPLEVPKGTP